MCWAIPSEVIQILEGNKAVVDTLGTKRVVSLDLIQEDVNVGDYLLIHVGFAIAKLDQNYALESLKLLEEIIQKEEENEIGNVV